ncbi:MAG: oxidoreductase [Acidobacteria bacterium]|jgi:PhzF family phenazine biosynthesis protein|nr:oxidoreductase [Acidobacteriota bacterium]
MTLTIYQVDAFTERPFAGNPAAVVPLERPAAEPWMRDLAAEMNLSETAFLWPEGEAWRLRWFTPEAEVRLCGHATLASSHVLWETGRLAPAAPARFDTLSGRLVARRLGEAIEMDFPARSATPVAALPGLAEALGAQPLATARSAEDVLVELADEWTVRALAPDFAALRALDVRGVIATAAADPGRDFDFVSRFFAPAVGVPEDPVTGSSHCTLAPFWSARLGRAELTGLQVSRRGGRVRTRLAGERVQLGGRAVTVFAGALSEAAAG